jgi:hypothetical protein
MKQRPKRQPGIVQAREPGWPSLAIRKFQKEQCGFQWPDAQDEKLRRATDVADDVQAKLEIFIRQREADCQKAIGHQPFCNCLMKGLPIAWSFSDYIAITTRSKEDNGYTKMKIETRLAYDKVGPIRNLCVKILHTPRKQQH